LRFCRRRELRLNFRDRDLNQTTKEKTMFVPLLILLLVVLLFGGLGFAAHVLWIILLVLVVLWLVGFLLRGADAAGGRRRWYRW
jgi:hypothetical protein